MNQRSIALLSRIFTTGGIIFLIIGLMFSIVGQTASADGPLDPGTGGGIVEPPPPPSDGSDPTPPTDIGQQPGGSVQPTSAVVQPVAPTQPPASGDGATAPQVFTRKPQTLATFTPIQQPTLAPFNPQIDGKKPLRDFTSFDLTDQASLGFSNSCDNTECGKVSVTVCNIGGVTPTQRATINLFYSASGDPRTGSRILNSLLPYLAPGECIWVFEHVSNPGNYIFQVIQPSSYYGPREIWGDNCTVNLGCALRTVTATPRIPTATPTATATATETATPTATTTATETATPTATTTATETATPTATETATETATPTATATATETATPTATETATETATPTVTTTGTITPPPPPGDDPTRTPTMTRTVPPPPGDDPTKTPTTPPGKTPVKSPTPGGGVLIPVTGADQTNPIALQSLMMYIGLLMLGIGLVIAGISKSIIKVTRS